MLSASYCLWTGIVYSSHSLPLDEIGMRQLLPNQLFYVHLSAARNSELGFRCRFELLDSEVAQRCFPCTVKTRYKNIVSRAAS
jgi:hypothetical protein